jgi:hypothetical protein
MYETYKHLISKQIVYLTQVFRILVENRDSQHKKAQTI